MHSYDPQSGPAEEPSSSNILPNDYTLNRVIQPAFHRDCPSWPSEAYSSYVPNSLPLQWPCSPLIPEDAGQSTEDCGMQSVKGAVIPSSNTSNSTNHPPKGVTVQTSGKGSISITSTTAIMESTTCLLYTSPSPRDRQKSRMPSSA